MKRLINENIERAAEWLKTKKELQTKLKDLEESCEHWVAYDSNSYKTEDKITILEDCLICDFCNKVLYSSSKRSDELYKQFVEKQKKIFDYKYRA